MKYILVGIFLFISSFSFSQDRGFYSEGREFLLGYLHAPFLDSIDHSYSPYQLYAMISSSSQAKVWVSYYDNSGNTVEQVVRTLPESNSLQLPLVLSKLKNVIGKGDAAEYNTCRITSDVPITVTYVSVGSGAVGSYLALPVSSWGKKYVVSSYNDVVGFFNSAWWAEELRRYTCGQFCIVAGYNGTIVSITPTCKTEGGAIGVNQGPGTDGTPKPYTITLNKGQSYLVKSGSWQWDGEDDISGSIVEANQPIAVISGHQNASTGDGLADESMVTDNRDFLIEQMIPVEFWDNQGIYTVPMMEASGNPINGLGENVRIYVSNTSVPSTVNVFSSGTSSQSISPVSYKANELYNQRIPLGFSTEDEQSRFSVIQYELRSQMNYLDFSAPSMLTIVPRSEWKNTALWRGYFYGAGVGVWEYDQSYFVTVIAPSQSFDNIKVSVRNNPFVPISNSMSAVKTWGPGTMPIGSDLKAVTYRVDRKDSYFARSDHPFVVYQFGSRVTSIGGDSPGDGDDFSGGEAHPVAMKLLNIMSTKQLNITIDTLCSGWNICVTDDNANGGIRFVTLIDDPKALLYYPKSYVYKNCLLPVELDPLGLNEFSLPGDKKNLCFTVNLINPGEDVYVTNCHL